MPRIPNQRNNASTCCAGEHYVAYQLSVRGYLVALTRGGSPSIDLMVATSDGQKAVTIQVKTATNASVPCKRKPENSLWNWPVGSKALDLSGESVFYAFVDLREGTEKAAKSMLMPEVFIVPAEFVREHLNPFPKPPKKPTTFWFDIFEKDKEKWHENWDLIEAGLS
jgi:hypothetical protein